MFVLPLLPPATLDFVSYSMLGWLGAGILPCLVHYWFRRRHRTTSWAAMALLLAAVEKQAMRTRIQQWLLMAVRTAILLFVALAAAQPVWREWTMGLAEGHVHCVLVVDQSYSMRCVREGTTRFARAQQKARQLVAKADTVTIIAWGAQAENLVGRPTSDRGLAESVVDRLSPGYTSSDLDVALRAVSSAIERADQEIPPGAIHRVFFLTDLGRNTWGAAPSEQVSLNALAQRAALTVIDVGDDQRENIAITDLSIDPVTVLRQREVAFTASLQNLGEQPRMGLRVEFFLDGVPINSQSVDLPAGGEQAVRFSHRFVDEGEATIEATIGPEADCLPADNNRYLVVSVRSKLRVACLVGSAGGVEDVVRALSFTEGAVETEVFPISRLQSLDLTAYDAALLARGTHLSPREQFQLSSFVSAGGAVAVLLGDASVSTEMLPVKIIAPVVAGEYRFDPLGYHHPIVQPFRGREKSGLLGVLISRYVRMEPAEHAETVLAFDSGDPALVVARHGLGRVAVLALPASLEEHEGAPWSSFAVSPSFLPVMRELVGYLVGDSRFDRHNLYLGQSAVSALAPLHGRQRYKMRLPTGQSTGLSAPGPEDRGQILFSGTQQVGVYAMHAGGQEFARFAVNLDASSSRSDSMLAAVAADKLPEGITTSAPAAEIQVAAGDFSWARILLATVVALLFVELTLAWFLGRGWA
ncbi:MAG: BatA domain-containing protein [Pirellulales bacterium]|nr:BatA domain-containing protein [Pirellulales bacterium]